MYTSFRHPNTSELIVRKVKDVQGSWIELKDRRIIFLKQGFCWIESISPLSEDCEDSNKFGPVINLRMCRI